MRRGALLKSRQDGWSEGLQESESGLDRNDERRACLSYKIEGREEGSEERERERMWQREIYGKRKLERGGCGGVEYVMKERRAFSDSAAFVE